MPTDAINDQSIPENLKRLLKIYADAYIGIWGKEGPGVSQETQMASLRANQDNLLFKLLIAHVTCEGLSSKKYQ